MLRILLLTGLVMVGQTLQALALEGRFTSIDGGEIDLGDFRGKPVLVVNTASLCGFAGQYEGLQNLYDLYRERGLVVLAVPSDDFNQELASATEVKSYCEVTYGIDLPMTDITHVRGKDAHPFYQAVQAETGFVPKWNFNKILVTPDGSVGGTWGAMTKPESAAIKQAIDAVLP